MAKLLSFSYGNGSFEKDVAYDVLRSIRAVARILIEGGLCAGAWRNESPVLCGNNINRERLNPKFKRSGP